MTVRRASASPAATLGIRDLPVASLKPHPANPRRISSDALDRLKRMLTDDPAMLQARPLIALPDGTVIAGNQRLRAAVELGWDTIPVFTVDLDRDRAELWALRDNLPLGEWEDETLAQILAGLDERGVDLALTGFDSATVDELLAGIALEDDRDPDAAPAVPAVPRSRPGEVYELGPHRLMCGDATDADQVAELMCGETAGLLVTDPPYGVNYQGDEDPESLRRRHRRGDGKATLANDALGDEGTRLLVATALRVAAEHAAPGAPFYVFSPSGLSELAFRLAVTDAALELRQVIVWAKDVFAFGRQDYHWRHESILYGWFPGARHTWIGGRGQDTVWEIPRPKRSQEHPTMKPVELVARAIANSSRRGEIVLDLFGGSGSTLIAADQLGRRAFLMELDPGYCDVIRDRYQAWTDGSPR